MPDHLAVLARFEADGLLRREGNEYRTTRRWQTAMARAAFHLYGAGDPGDDLRTPIAYALLELYGNELSDDEIATYVAVMAPVEAAELDPEIMLKRAHAHASDNAHD